MRPTLKKMSALTAVLAFLTMAGQSTSAMAAEFVRPYMERPWVWIGNVVKENETRSYYLQQYDASNPIFFDAIVVSSTGPAMNRIWGNADGCEKGEGTYSYHMVPGESAKEGRWSASDTSIVSTIVQRQCQFFLKARKK